MEDNNMIKTTVKVDGMMCGMCESTFYHRLREYRATLNSEKNHCKKVHLNTKAIKVAAGELTVRKRYDKI